MDITLENICIPSADVVAREVDGRLVIVPLVEGVGDADREIYTLNETGRSIWHKLDGEKTLKQVALELADEFAIPLEQLERDVLGLVSDMIKGGLCLQLNNKGSKQNSFNSPASDQGDEGLPSRHAADASDSSEPSSYITGGGELRLSNPGQLELLRGMEERGVPLRTTVRGFSMSPFIRDLDVLTISPLKNKRPRIGDVVAFSHPENGRLAIHRIIKKTFTGWVVKGDNCQEADGLVATENIIGRVIRIERNKKKVKLGLGVSGRTIAFLNRGRGLNRLKKLFYLPRRGASLTLRRLQSISLYRKITRRLMTAAVISEADEKDMESVHRLFKPGTPYTTRKPNPNVTNFVATNDNKVIGFAQLVYHPEDNYPWNGYWLFSLYVWAPYRGMSIGERLISQCIEEAKNKKASELLLVVYEDNMRAINLNTKLGFSIVTHPALEPLFEAEKEKTGRRRIVMSKILEENR